MPSTTDAIRITFTFPAPAARVFEAFTRPADLQLWAWGTIAREVEAEADPRPGGAYRISTLNEDGSRAAFHGTFAEVEAPSRLVYTLHWDAEMGYDCVEERITVALAERDGATEMVFTHEGVPAIPAARDGHVAGWTNTFEVLAEMLAGE
jgi:uncharacterized protein YndB with AHSA1/START domain